MRECIEGLYRKSYGCILENIQARKNVWALRVLLSACIIKFLKYIRLDFLQSWALPFEHTVYLKIWGCSDNFLIDAFSKNRVQENTRRLQIKEKPLTAVYVPTAKSSEGETDFDIAATPAFIFILFAGCFQGFFFFQLFQLSLHFHFSLLMPVFSRRNEINQGNH